jgi:hypothetical protein
MENTNFIEPPFDKEENNNIETNELLLNNNRHIDKLTMELLLNKNHYSKYLQHTDAKLYDEFKLFKNKLRKHSIDIIDITSELIENPKKIINKDIEETFEIYVKSIIRYLEIKEVENLPTFQKEEDEDVLFGNMNKESTQLIEKSEEPVKSYWGKEIVKKSKNILNADMNLFRIRK